MHRHDTLFIGGTWSSPSTDDAIEVISPHSESVIARVAAAGPTDVGAAVAGAREAFDGGPWPRLDPADRIEAVRRLAKLYGAAASVMTGTNPAHDTR